MARAKIESVSAKQYMAVLRKLSRHKKKGGFKAWFELSKRAARMRAKMISSNPHSAAQMPQYEKGLMAKMPADYRKMYSAALKTTEGRKVNKLFKEFWKIPVPPKIEILQGGPKGRTIFLMGMGTAPEVHLSATNKGERKKTAGKAGRTVLKGKWKIASDSSGRHVLILSDRPIKGPFKFVGYAPETNYVPTPDIEKAGTHKKGRWWRHLHGENDSNKKYAEHQLKWPAVFADRNGKVDKSSNFIYGTTPSAKIKDWMYG